MTEAKHEFVDDYPYLVYTSQDTLVYSDKADTSIDDIGDGGDFSTATVTLITDDNAPEGNYFVSGAFAASAYDAGIDCSVSIVSFDVEPQTKTVILYKGTAACDIYEGDLTEGCQYATATVTGNATVDENYVEITGDCTITVTGVASE